MSRQFDDIKHSCRRGSKTCQISEDSLWCLLEDLILEQNEQFCFLHSMEIQSFHNPLIYDDILLQNCYGNLAAASKLDMQGWIFIFLTWVLDGYLRCSSSSSTFSGCQVRRGHGCPILVKAKSKLCAFRANWKVPVSVRMWEQLWRTQRSSVRRAEKRSYETAD